MKKDKIIFLDMDGVLVDLLSQIESYFGLPKGKLYKTKNPGNIHLDVVMTEKDFWGKFDRINFWASLPKYPWSDDLVHHCINKEDFGYKTIILTSPSKTALNSATGKLMWLKKHYPFFISANEVIITNNKDSLAGAGRILIDDTLKKCFGFLDSGGKSILFPQPYNKNTVMDEGGDFFKPKNIKEVFKIIKGLK